MADYCRPEVASDVISGRRAFGVEIVPLTKFGDPSSNRLATIQNAADGQTEGHACKKSPSYALCIATLHQWSNKRMLSERAELKPTDAFEDQFFWYIAFVHIPEVTSSMLQPLDVIVGC